MNIQEVKDIFKYSSDKDSKQKSTLSEWVCYLAMFFLVVYGTKAYFQDMFVYSMTHFIILGITLLNIFIYKKTENLKFIVWHINIVFSIFLCYMLFTGGTGRDTGLIWFQIFPLLTFAINGLTVGVFMVTFYIALAVVATVFTDLPFVTHEYPQNVVYSFYGTIFFIIVASFISEYSRVKAHMLEDNFRSVLIERSERDELTGTYNRRHMNEEIKHLFSLKKDFSLAFADIDNFKNINDTYGHDIGDEVIKQVAKAFQDSLRNDDYLARWGGEEFILVLKDTQLRTAKAIIERIRKHIEKIEINIGNRQTINITCSFGVEHSSNAIKQDELISKADHKLYQAKKIGKNIVIS